MGAVYLAEHVEVGRKVALKVLADEWMTSEQARRRFLAEARAAAKIVHRSVIEVLDAGELEDGRPFLVMEYVAGVSIGEVLAREGAFETVRAVRVARDLASALALAHRVGIVHRDVKPQNVMLVASPTGDQTKLLDFGIASIAEFATGRLTYPGLVLGTPTYMAPEQAAGADASPAFDVYALGVMTFEMLSGSPPITGETVDLLLAKAKRSSPSLASVRPDLPRELVDLVDSCLAIRVEQRPREMNDVCRRLERVLSVLVPQTKVARRRSMHAGPRARAPLHLAIAAALYAGVAWTAAVASSNAHHEVATESTPPQRGTAAEPAAAYSAAISHTPLAVRRERGPSRLPPSSSTGVAPKLPARSSGPSETSRSTRRPRSPSSLQRMPEPHDCARARERALDARNAHDWEGLLRHTRDSACWTSAAERTRLQVKASMELGLFDDCARVGADLRDPVGARWVELCRRRLAATNPK